MYKLTAKQLHHQFISGKVSATEITEYFLNRIEQYDTKLNAFLHVMKEPALKRAKLLDEKRASKKPLGKLAGIPIAVKDNILIEGEINTCGSNFLTNYKAPYNATVCSLLEEEDAILIGKTNLDEFAMGGSGIHSAFGPTKNPWNLDCSPGGSSSGSAAAVSARLCPFALGSDTGGSIRQPAALTGITGFKPTYGRVSRYGLVAFASSLDQVGPFSYTAEDAALIMEVLGAHCKNDSTSIATPPPPFLKELDHPISGTKIGVPWSFLEQLEPKPLANFKQSLEVYKQLGVEFVDVNLSMLNYGIAVYYVLATAEASTNLARFDGIRYGVRSPNAKTLEEIYDLSREEGFGSEVKNRILLGTYVLSSSHVDAFYAKAQRVRTLLIKQVREAFAKCDMIALPVAPDVAFPLSRMDGNPLSEYLQDLYTVGINLAGLPAISIPSGLSEDKKPYGLQIIGPQLHDSKVLCYAHAFQKATDFASLIPSEFGGAL